MRKASARSGRQRYDGGWRVVKTAAQTASRLDSLQILRFFAAFLVLVGHTQHALLERLGAGAGRYAFVPLDWGLGVDVFFVISGFVMYYLMHGRFAQPGATATFLRRRIVRVVPMYWLFTTLVLAVGLATGAIDLPWTNILFSYLFLPGPVCGEYCFPVFTLGWTINYEMLFYALFALALGFSRRTGVAVVVGLIVALIVVGQVVPASWSMLHFWGYPIIGEFLFGIGLAAAFLRGWRVSRPTGWAMVAAGLVLAIVSYQLDLYDHIWRLWTGGIPAALILGGAVFGLEPRGEHGRWLTLLVLGGDASYALYLSHPVTIRVTDAIAGKIGLFDHAPWMFWAGTVVAAVIGSFVVHFAIEKPLLSRFYRRPNLGAGVP